MNRSQFKDREKLSQVGKDALQINVKGSEGRGRSLQEVGKAGLNISEKRLVGNQAFDKRGSTDFTTGTSSSLATKPWLKSQMESYEHMVDYFDNKKKSQQAMMMDRNQATVLPPLRKHRGISFMQSVPTNLFDSIKNRRIFSRRRAPVSKGQPVPSKPLENGNSSTDIINKEIESLKL